jgi:hypothetical protein
MFALKVLVHDHDMFLTLRLTGAVGGSVAWGHGASQVGVTDFASLFFAHLNVSLRDALLHPHDALSHGGLPALAHEPTLTVSLRRSPSWTTCAG